MLKIPDQVPPRKSVPVRRREDADEARPDVGALRTVGRKQVLGWKEEVLIPSLGDLRLPAKLDTGARTSALHAIDIIYVRQRSAIWVEFDLPDVDQSRRHRFRLPLAEHRSVKSSIGSSQIRPVVLLNLSLAGQSWSTEVTLTDRSDMELPMLIGRSALKGRFVVDPARTRLAGSGSAGGIVPTPRKPPATSKRPKIA